MKINLYLNLNKQIAGRRIFKWLELAVFAAAFLFVAFRVSTIFTGFEFAPLQRQYLVVACSLLLIALSSTSSILGVLAGEKELDQELQEPFGVSWNYLFGFFASLVVAWAVTSWVPPHLMLIDCLSARLLCFAGLLTFCFYICSYDELQGKHWKS